MTTEHSNPFVLPGFGQSGEGAQNPVFAGMEMMRKAWQGMAGAGVSGFESAGMPIMSIEDLEKRISELQAVENWLRLNLSMLSNTIQGMEIQRSTMATLRSFAAQGMPESFGAKPSTTQASAAQATPAQDSTSSRTPAGGMPDTQPYAQAAEHWWNLVQEQFQSLAAATAAQTTPKPAARSATKATKSATKATTKSASKSTSKSAPKAAKSATKSTAQPAAKSTRRTAAAKRATRRPS